MKNIFSLIGLSHPVASKPFSAPFSSCITKRGVFGLAAGFLGLLLGFVLLEAGIRVYLTLSFHYPCDLLTETVPCDLMKNHRFGEIMRRDSNPRLLYTFKPHMDCLVHGVRLQTNELGFNDRSIEPKASQTLRIMCLGDSTMAGYAVPRQACYVELLEAELQMQLQGQRKVEFINTAVFGYNSVQELETFLRYENKLQPDAVLIQYDQNDIDRSTILIKPDYLFARFIFTLHPVGLVQNKYVDGNAIIPLRQEKLALFEDDFSGWSAQAAAYIRLAGLCAQRKIPLIAMTICESQPGILWNGPRSSQHEAIAALCESLHIPLIEGERTVISFLLKHGLKDYESVKVARVDIHPNMLGHGLLALAALPTVTRVLLNQTGITTQSLPGYSRLANLTLRQIINSSVHEGISSR